jgi:hypothetical protein
MVYSLKAYYQGHICEKLSKRAKKNKKNYNTPIPIVYPVNTSNSIAGNVCMLEALTPKVSG